MDIIKTNNARYLRIREDKNGRTIEAWVVQNNPAPPVVQQQTKSLRSSLLVVSMFGWGIIGIALGNFLFYGV